MEEGFVTVKAGAVTLEGVLVIPKKAHGLVLFAHGSGSGRHSPRNQFVARSLQNAGIATLLIDLLTLEEEKKDLVTAHLRFDIPLLSERLVSITEWLESEPRTKELSIGYFGASTGAAAALIAATHKKEVVKAIVSRGGRPDLALKVLSLVKAPTLLIVGGNDFGVIELNEIALKELKVEKKLAIVPGATHLFEEKGALEEVARLSIEWFHRYLK